MKATVSRVDYMSAQGGKPFLTPDKWAENVQCYRRLEWTGTVGTASGLEPGYSGGSGGTVQGSGGAEDVEALSSSSEEGGVPGSSLHRAAFGVGNC